MSEGMVHTLTPAQADVVRHYQGYNVPAQWFIGAERDNGEVIAVGEDFVWSFLIEADGQRCDTSEAALDPEGFSTGLDI